MKGMIYMYLIYSMVLAVVEALGFVEALVLIRVKVKYYFDVEL